MTMTMTMEDWKCLWDAMFDAAGWNWNWNGVFCPVVVLVFVFVFVFVFVCEEETPELQWT